MIVFLKKAAAAGVIFILLFSSCGDADSLFPSPRTYEVSAAIGGVSLDSSALVKEGDRIQPYFLHSTRGDADIYGLRVSVETLSGVQAGEVLLYHTGELEDEADDDAPAAGDLTEDSGNNSKTPDPAGGDPLEAPPGFSENEPRDSALGNVLEPAESRDVPRNLPVETKKDKFILVKQLHENLPAFSLPAALEPGTYMMVFQVLGEEKTLLAKNEITFYYLADMDYDIAEIKASLPGFSSTPYLVQPETSVLLEAHVEAGRGLDPYITWYSGRTRIRAGRLADGAGRFLWTIPGSLSFLHLKAEVTPFPPPGNSRGSSSAENLRGKIKELSIPVSSKARIEGTLDSFAETRIAEDPERELSYYRFEGNLLDSLDQAKKLEALPNPANSREKEPLWISSGYIYGLAVGPHERYKVPFPLKAAATPDEMRRYELMLNFSPLAPGVIFTVRFSEQRVEFNWNGENITLDLYAAGGQRQIPIPLPGTGMPDSGEEPRTEAGKFIVLPVDFTVEGQKLAMILGEEKISIEIAPGDEGIIQLGGDPLPPQTLVSPSPPVMILDELVLISYPGVPVIVYSDPGETSNALASL